MSRRSQTLVGHVKAVSRLVSKKLPAHRINRSALASHIRKIRNNRGGRGTTPLMQYLSER